MEHKSVPLASLKAVAEGGGGFEGYASLFDVVDDGKDRVRPGAYAKTLDQFKQNGFIGLSHDWDALPIGYIEEAHEDAKGLYVKVRYHSTPIAQDARKVAQERMDAGKSVALSIGYDVAEGGAERKDGVRDLNALNLYEISQVNVPMLRSAGIANVKSREAKAVAGTYEERIGQISAAVTAYFGSRNGGGMADPFDSTVAPDDAYAYPVETYPDHAIVSVYEDGLSTYYSFPYTVDADGAIILGAPAEVEKTYTPVKGLTIAAHAHEALTVSRAFVDRTKSLADVRAKEGRVLSAGNRQRLAALRAQMLEAASAAETLLAETEHDQGGEADAMKSRTTALAEMARFEAFRARQFVSVA